MKIAAIGSWSLDNKKIALTIVSLIILISFACYFRLSFDNSPESFFLKNDPTVKMYQKFKADFGSDEYTFIVMDSPHKWDAPFIDKVSKLTKFLQNLEHVTKVTSIVNVRYIEGEADSIRVGDFMADISTADALAAKKQVALAHPFYKDFLVSADGTKIGIIAQTESITNDVMYKIRITDAIRGLINSAEYADLHPKVVGAPIIDADVFKIINLESILFGTISFIVVALGFYFIFRSWIGAVIPLLVATLSILVAIGLMGALDAPMSLLTPIMPGFLISVGVGSSVFLMAEIYQQQLAGKNLRQAVIAAYRESAATSVVSVLTTAGALLSFSWSDVKPAQDVGQIMAGGLIASVVFALLLTPIMLSFFGGSAPTAKFKKIFLGRNRNIEAVSDVVIKYWKQMLIAFAFIIGIAGFGATKLKVDYYYVGLFKENTDIWQSYHHVDNALRGSASMEVVFEVQKSGDAQSKRFDDIKDPEVLNAISAFQQQFEAKFQKFGLKTYSVADVVKEIHKAINSNNPDFYRIPDSRKEVAEEIFIFESSGSDELHNMVTADSQAARVNFRLKYRPESEYADLFREMEKFVKEQASLNPNLKIYMTGIIPLWSQLTTYLYETELQAISLSALCVLLVMIIIFRSITLGVIIMLCNLVPVAIILGVMGYFQIILDPFTMLVSAIAIGILDDDTMHFVRGFLNHYAANGRDVALSLRHSFLSSGQSILLLSMVLICGFLVYGLSQVASLAKFGGLTALAIAAGAFCELFFTPAVLVACDKLGILRTANAKTTVIHTNNLSTDSNEAL